MKKRFVIDRKHYPAFLGLKDDEVFIFRDFIIRFFEEGTVVVAYYDEKTDKCKLNVRKRGTGMLCCICIPTSPKLFSKELNKKSIPFDSSFLEREYSCGCSNFEHLRKCCEFCIVHV